MSYKTRGVEVRQHGELVSEYLDSVSTTDEQVVAEAQKHYGGIVHVTVQTNNRGPRRQDARRMRR